MENIYILPLSGITVLAEMISLFPPDRKFLDTMEQTGKFRTVINSVKDDRYFVAPDGKNAYLSSNRVGGMGQEDIYTIDLGFTG